MRLRLPRSVEVLDVEVWEAPRRLTAPDRRDHLGGDGRRDLEPWLEDEDDR